MAYTNPRGLDNNSDIGPTIKSLCQCTLADYAVAGTVAPVVNDIVTFSTTGNWYAKIVPDNVTKLIGRVSKITKAPVGAALGQIEVEWLDVVGFRYVDTDDLSTITLGNAAIKDGDTSVVNNFDALATTGNLIVVAKSGTTGAGTAVCALLVG